MGLIQGKVWGSTEVLLKTPFIEVHRIFVNPNSFCSVHKHERKWNAFYVLDGELYIEVVKNDYELTDTTLLLQGEFTTVKPGEYHNFLTKEHAVSALEIYYLEGLSEDIIRQSVGGVI